MPTLTCSLCGFEFSAEDLTMDSLMKHQRTSCVPGKECEYCGGTGQIEEAWYNRHGVITMWWNWACGRCNMGWKVDSSPTE